MKPRRFVAFARVSTKVQGDEGYSLEVQEDRLIAYSRKKGGEIVRLWKATESAFKEYKRHDFLEMIEYAGDPRNKIDGIVFDRINRAMRGPVGISTLKQFVDKTGIHCYFITEDIDTTNDENWSMIMMLGAMAFRETAQLKQAVIRAQRQRVADGKFHSTAPFGYKNYRDDVTRKNLVRVNPKAAEAVKFIFEKFTVDGLSRAQIATELERHGHVFSTKKPKFSYNNLTSILSHRAYIGEIPCEGKWTKGDHIPLIPIPVFQRAASLLQGKKYGGHTHLFGTGMIKCGSCGGVVTGYPASKYKGTDRQDEFTYYFCGACRRARRPFRQVKQPALEEQVLSLFSKMRTDDEEIRNWFVKALAIQAQRSGEAKATETAGLDLDIAAISTKENGLFEAYSGGAYTVEELRKRQQALREERDILIERRTALGQQADQDADDAVAAFELANNLGKRWKSADLAAKRRLLNVVCSNWTLKGVTLVPTMRRPFDALVEGPLISSGRVGCLEFKPTEIVNAVVNPFLGPPEPHLLRLPALLGAA